MSIAGPRAGTIDFPRCQAAGASRSWCATYGKKGVNDNCSYSSFNQCYQTVLGLGGFCKPNPFPGTAYGTGYSWSGPMR